MSYLIIIERRRFNIEAHIVLILAVVLFSTKLCGTLTQRIHLPQVVGALLAGILVGPSVLKLIEPNETISILSDLGVIVLLFTAGMETDFKQLKKSAKPTLLIGAFGVILSLAGGFAAAAIVGKSSFECFFIGVIIASTSTSITVEALQEMGKLKTKSGSAIVSASVVDDTLGIILFAVVMVVNAGGLTFASVAVILVKVIAFFVFAIVCGWLISHWLTFVNKKFGEVKMVSVFALAFCFLMAYLAEKFGLANITGAYVAGVAFSNTAYVKSLENKVQVLSYLFLSPVFFASIGINMVFSGLNANTIVFTGLLLIAVVFSKLIGCGLGAKVSGFTNRESLRVGAGMITRGEVSIVIAGKGITAGIVDADLFSCVILVVLATVLIAPVLLKTTYAEKKKA